MRKRNRRWWLILLILGGLLASACSITDILSQVLGEGTVDEETLATMVAIEAQKAVELTLQAMVTDTPQPTDEPAAEQTGTIRGSLGYPSSFIPPLRVVAFNLDSGAYFDVDTELNQTEYEITGLPPGRYHVLAYVQEMGADIAGGYSEFVLCGLHVDCTDHTLVEVVVGAGQVVDEVDPVDFYMEPGAADWPEEPQ